MLPKQTKQIRKIQSRRRAANSARRTRAARATSIYPEFPDMMKVAIRYSTRINYSSSALNVYNVGVSSLQTFQGFYRDQLLALYKNYVVEGFTVKYKIQNTDVLGVGGEIIWFDCPSSETAGLTFAQMLEYPGSEKKLLSSTGNHMALSFEKHYDLSKVYKRRPFDDTDMWGTAAAAPGFADPQDHCLAIYSFDGVSTVKALIDREYIFHVLFFRRENPGNSLTDTSLSIKPAFPEKKKALPKKGKQVVVTDSD